MTTHFQLSRGMKMCSAICISWRREIWENILTPEQMRCEKLREVTGIFKTTTLEISSYPDDIRSCLKLWKRCGADHLFVIKNITQYFLYSSRSHVHCLQYCEHEIKNFGLFFYSDQSPTPPGGSALLPKVTVSKPGRQIDIVSKNFKF